VRRIALSFVVSMLASVGLFIVYIVGGQPQVEGSLIALALGGLAVGLISWAHNLMPSGHFVQEREPHTSLEDRVGLEADARRSTEGIRRRAFLGRLLAGAVGLVGLAALFPVRSLGIKPGRALFHTAWRRGARLQAEDGTFVAVGTLDIGGIVTVFPEGHIGSADSQTVLIRVDPSTFRPLPGRLTWSPEGYLAYSKVCTHAGCPVGLYQVAAQELFCPCHQSAFNVLAGAEPVAGPATRPLPQLPLMLDARGFLRAQSDYRTPIGPGFWNDPAQ
jgi:ubiquinol-cytochrome c reductase iron-sulfur subunit